MIDTLRKVALTGLAWSLLVGTTQGPEQPSLNWLHGNWRGDASIQNRPAKASLSFGPALNNTAIEMDFKLDAAADGDKPALHLEGKAVYRMLPDGSVAGQWSDSFGNFHRAAGKVRGQVLIVDLFDGQIQTAQVGYETYANGDLRLGYWAKTNGQLSSYIQSVYHRVD